ncbi:radical SAM protein [Candidatus Woesearchaeota archaeon]|nr:radical SAM protein [Candidatus Woesearchaeota archaeon]
MNNHPAIEAVRRMFYMIPTTPSYVQFEITNECNLACKMCPREVLGVKFINMDFEMFKRLVDKLEGVTMVSLTGWGEPLVHPNLIEMIKYCKFKGIITKFTTNGVLFTPALLQGIFDAKLDEITFSIDSIAIDPKNEWGHLNKVALKYIQQILTQRKDHNGFPKLTLQVMLQKGRAKDIFDVIEWGSQKGADKINIGRLNLSFDPNLVRPSLEEEQHILDTAEELGEKHKIQIDCIQGGIGAGFTRKVYKATKKYLHKGGKHCLKTYDYCYVNVHGKITPCCLLPNYAVGDFNTVSLKEIWNSEKFNHFRANEEKICGSCDVMRVNMLDQSGNHANHISSKDSQQKQPQLLQIKL